MHNLDIGAKPFFCGSNLDAFINVFMSRVTEWRSRLCPSRCLLQMLLLAIGLAFITRPAWSLPVELVSHSAIDLVEARQRSEGVKGIDASAVSSQQPVSNPALPPHSPLPTPHSLVPIDLDPKLIESSPVLQRWLKQVPDVLADIKHDPSFRTRLRLSYSQFPSSKQAGGLSVGIEDVFVGRSGVTLSADYQTAFNGSREAWGGDLRYYVRPLGSVVNLAPVVGYRHLETTRYSTNGIHAGLRLLLIPSRTGAADLALTQSWVAPGSGDEVGLTTLSFGYALTRNLRLATDLQKQNSRFRSDSRVSIGLEWLF